MSKVLPGYIFVTDEENLQQGTVRPASVEKYAQCVPTEESPSESRNSRKIGKWNGMPR
jgi:hypothetical protein